MKRFSVARTIQVSMFLSIIVTTYGGYAYSQSGVLLNCELEGGYPDNQIYINEGKGYVIYNAHLGENYERQRDFKSDPGKARTLDVGMDITANNDDFILAKDDTASFVFIKDTATFAYAWAMPVPLQDGKFLAFANFHQGKCSANPFSHPDE